jgi:hypothetical protein
MGPTLKAIGGDTAVDILLHMHDFGLQQFSTPEGPQVVPANAMINFRATRFREFPEGSDVWEFMVSVASAGGPVNGYIYVRGTEIATIKALSKIA